MRRPTDPGWKAATHIIGALRTGGYRALLAGGCVRDMLLSRVPKDYDVATDAVPEEVLKLFPRARKVGAKFGVVLVRALGQDVEVATFRSEGTYSDGRHPDQVAYGNEEDDALRRDFTINGLFYDPVEDQVIDLVGGRADLEKKILRTIGDPAARFAEDHLRMLRAVRIASRLGLAIEPATAEAVRRLSEQLDVISRERVWMELEQILVPPSRAAGWALLTDLGLRGRLSPNWPVNGENDARAGARLAALPPVDLPAALPTAAVVCDLSPRQIQAIAGSLRWSNRLAGDTIWLVRSLRTIADEHALELAALKRLMAHRRWTDLLKLLHADLGARHRDLSHVQPLLDRAGAILPEKIAPPPLVTGGDLTNLGFVPGPRFGPVLEELYRRQLNEELTDRKAALSLARELLGG